MAFVARSEAGTGRPTVAFPSPGGAVQEQGVAELSVPSVGLRGTGGLVVSSGAESRLSVRGRWAAAAPGRQGARRFLAPLWLFTGLCFHRETCSWLHHPSFLRYPAHGLF